MKLKLKANKTKNRTIRQDVLSDVQSFAGQLIKMANLKQKLLVMSR